MVSFNYSYGNEMATIFYDDAHYVFQLPFEGIFAVAERDCQFGHENEGKEKFKLWYGSSHGYYKSDADPMREFAKKFITEQECKYIETEVIFESAFTQCNEVFVTSINLEKRCRVVAFLD